MIENFEHLVERCTARRKKRLIRFSLITAGALVASIAVIAGLYNIAFTNEPEPADMRPSDINTTPVQPLALPESKPIPKPVEKPDKESEEADVKKTKTASVTEKAEAKSEKESSPKLPAPEEAPVIQTVSAPAPTQQPLRLLEVSSAPIAADPLKAYSARPRYDTAMVIARDYYAKGNFSDAAVWAKKANQLNREAEEAWLLYAKSYYAQGKKADALSILELYLNYKDSRAAQELLRSWKQTP